MTKIALHEEFGLNPSIKVCKYCHQDNGLYFYGNTIEGRAPTNEIIECFGNCIAVKMVVLLEVDDAGNEMGYCVRTTPEKAWKSLRINTPGVHKVHTEVLKRVTGDTYRSSGKVNLKEHDDKD